MHICDHVIGNVDLLQAPLEQESERFNTEYWGIPHLKKCFLRKQDTEIFESLNL